jgi:hypothetical protein
VAERGGGNGPKFEWIKWPVLHSAAERAIIIELVEYLVNGLVTGDTVIATISRD